MYNLNGIKLELDEELLKEYSKLILDAVGTTNFNEAISLLAETRFQTNSLEEAIYLYGIENVTKKIEIAIKDELNTFSIDID